MTMYLDSLDFNHHTTKTEKPKDDGLITTKLLIVFAIVAIIEIAVLVLWPILA